MSVKQREACSSVVTMAFQKTEAVGRVYHLSLAMTFGVLGGRMEQLPRLTHKPSGPTHSVNHSYCRVCRVTTRNIWRQYRLIFERFAHVPRLLQSA